MFTFGQQKNVPDPHKFLRGSQRALSASMPPSMNQREKDAAEYAAAVGMDAANTEAIKVLATKGPHAFAKHVFTDQESGKSLSYAEMRARFG